MDDDDSQSISGEEDDANDISRNRTVDINTTGEEDNDDSRCYAGGRDSPDFNRHYENNEDLTISNTIISNNNTTYKGHNNQFIKRAAA